MRSAFISYNHPMTLSPSPQPWYHRVLSFLGLRRSMAAMLAMVILVGMRYPDDEANLAIQFEVYDALYAWCKLETAKQP
jgi:hypothetical protein